MHLGREREWERKCEEVEGGSSPFNTIDSTSHLIESYFLKGDPLRGEGRMGRRRGEWRGRVWSLVLESILAKNLHGKMWKGLQLAAAATTAVEVVVVVKVEVEGRGCRNRLPNCVCSSRLVFHLLWVLSFRHHFLPVFSSFLLTPSMSSQIRALLKHFNVFDLMLISA